MAGTGEPVYHGKHGYPCTVDAHVDALEAARFDALVIPGGFAPDKLRRSPKVLALTKEIFDAGNPVAFICHAGWVPIWAKIVRGRRGTSVLREATRQEPQITKSMWESRMLALVRGAGLPEPRCNEALHAPDHGECYPDFYWPAYGLIVETDGWEAHRTLAAFRSDRAKDAALTAAGYKVCGSPGTWTTPPCCAASARCFRIDPCASPSLPTSGSGSPTPS